MRKKRVDPDESLVLSERLSILADQLQGASAELAGMVAELRVQSVHTANDLKQEIENERTRPE